jgi:hypothetical protein
MILQFASISCIFFALKQSTKTIKNEDDDSTKDETKTVPAAHLAPIMLLLSYEHIPYRP